MAEVTGLTKERMLAIEAASITDAEVVGDNLILIRHDGTEIDAGNVRGPGGSGGGAGAEHLQTFTSAANPWIVIHNLGTKAVTVKTYNSAGVEIEGDQTPLDDNRTRVDFYHNEAGHALAWT